MEQIASVTYSNFISINHDFFLIHSNKQQCITEPQIKFKSTHRPSNDARTNTN